jgi:hypothetical protein
MPLPALGRCHLPAAHIAASVSWPMLPPVPGWHRLLRSTAHHPAGGSSRRPCLLRSPLSSSPASDALLSRCPAQPPSTHARLAPTPPVVARPGLRLPQPATALPGVGLPRPAPVNLGLPRCHWPPPCPARLSLLDSAGPGCPPRRRWPRLPSLPQPSALVAHVSISDNGGCTIEYSAIN